jgi:hypothetical protein
MYAVRVSGSDGDARSGHGQRADFEVEESLGVRFGPTRRSQLRQTRANQHDGTLALRGAIDAVMLWQNPRSRAAVHQ